MTLKEILAVLGWKTSFSDSACKLYLISSSDSSMGTVAVAYFLGPLLGVVDFIPKYFALSTMSVLSIYPHAFLINIYFSIDALLAV